jgi:hypothetical protein
MARSITAYASAYQRTRTHATGFVRGEVFSLSYNVNGVIGAAAIDTVDWFTSNSQSISLGAESDSGNIASVVCTAGYGPGAWVKCKVTDDAGNVFVQVFDISVQSGPSFSGE